MQTTPLNFIAPPGCGAPCLGLEDLVDYEDGLQTDSIWPETDLRFLRDFILSSAMYIEQLEAIANHMSDEFWEAREHAYKIVTGLLIEHFWYDMEDDSQLD
jgi:hypothetical protein